MRKIKSDLLGLKVAVKQLKQSTHEQIMSLDDSASLAYADMRTLIPKMVYLDLCPWTQPKIPILSFNEMNSLQRTQQMLMTGPTGASKECKKIWSSLKPMTMQLF